MIKILNSEIDTNGIERHYILPIESLAAFDDLLKFVRDDFGLKTENRIDGPGSTVCKLSSDRGFITFVLSDTFGASLFGTTTDDYPLAIEVAMGIEERIREVTE